MPDTIIAAIYTDRRQRLANYFDTLGDIPGFIEPLACDMAKVLFQGDTFLAATDLRDFLGMEQDDYHWVFREGEATLPAALTPAFIAGKLRRSIDFRQSGTLRDPKLRQRASRHLKQNQAG